MNTWFFLFRSRREFRDSEGHKVNLHIQKHTIYLTLYKASEIHSLTPHFYYTNFDILSFFVILQCYLKQNLAFLISLVHAACPTYLFHIYLL
jgi:hypothetical protein